MYQNESFKIISKPKNPLLINIKSIKKHENVQQSGTNFLANLKAAPHMHFAGDRLLKLKLSTQNVRELSMTLGEDVLKFSSKSPHKLFFWIMLKIHRGYLVIPYMIMSRTSL